MNNSYPFRNSRVISARLNQVRPSAFQPICEDDLAIEIACGAIKSDASWACSRQWLSVHRQSILATNFLELS
jgi:hypothetical protein